MYKSGYWCGDSFLWRVSAKARVKEPIRPQYMLTMRMSFAIQFQLAHSPVERPQVVNAEEVSNRAGNNFTSG